MAPRKGSFDDKLARLSSLSKLGPAAAPELGRFLADSNAFVVSEAARIAGELELRVLVPELVAAFERLLSGGAGADRGCNVKRRVLKVLIELEADEPRIYRAGLRYTQEEFSPGPPPHDTAGGIRAMSAIALVRFDVPGAAHDVVPLLFDVVPEARIGAAEALRGTGEELCAALLFTKVLAGESDGDVLGACHRGMLALAPRRYLPVVGEAVVSGVEAAALALGESRLPGSLPYFEEALRAGNDAIVDTLLLGISLLRSDEALAYLLTLVASAPEARAALSLAALSLHRHDAKVVAKAREAVAARRSKKLSKVLEEKLGDG